MELRRDSKVRRYWRWGCGGDDLRVEGKLGSDLGAKEGSDLFGWKSAVAWGLGR